MTDHVLARNRFFEVLGGLNAENRSDNKVAMVCEIDMSGAEALRREQAIRTGMKPTYTTLVAKAIARTLRESPYANRIAIERPFWKRIVQLDTVDISVAVEKDTSDEHQAVFVGTIRDTDRKSLRQIADELHGLANATEDDCVRWRQLSWIVKRLPAALARFVLSVPKFFPSLWKRHRGGAVLISSPGKYGVDAILGTWPWPIGFSFGMVKERAVVVRGRVVARPTMTLTMSFDRRLMAGAPAARFFRAVCDKLEDACLEQHSALAVDTRNTASAALAGT